MSLYHLGIQRTLLKTNLTNLKSSLVFSWSLYLKSSAYLTHCASFISPSQQGAHGTLLKTNFMKSSFMCSPYLHHQRAVQETLLTTNLMKSSLVCSWFPISIRSPADLTFPYFLRISNSSRSSGDFYSRSTWPTWPSLPTFSWYLYLNREFSRLDSLCILPCLLHTLAVKHLRPKWSECEM